MADQEIITYADGNSKKYSVLCSMPALSHKTNDGFIRQAIDFNNKWSVEQELQMQKEKRTSPKNIRASCHKHIVMHCTIGFSNIECVCVSEPCRTLQYTEAHIIDRPQNIPTQGNTWQNMDRLKHNTMYGNTW
jgi:hypothetical protein